MVSLVQEQTDWLVPVCPPASRPEKATVTVFAPAPWLQSTHTTAGELSVNVRQVYKLGSSFLLLGLLAQHGLHNFDLSALAAVYVSYKIEKFRILAGAGSVEQLLHHDQGAVVVLNHTGQK